MKSITFHYEGKVRGQGRPRFTKNGHAYQDKKDAEYKQEIIKAYRKTAGDYSFGDSPVSVTVAVYRALPKTRAKSLKLEPDCFKPDVDNIAKAVLDALVNCCAIRDDRQVVKMVVRKYPRKRRSIEHMFITINEVSE